MDEENKVVSVEEMEANNDNVELVDVNEETKEERKLLYDFSEYEYELIAKIIKMAIGYAKVSDRKEWKNVIYKVWSNIRAGRILFPCTNILDEDVEDLHEIMDDEPEKRRLVVVITYLWTDSFTQIMEGFIPEDDTDFVLMDYICNYFKMREDIDNPVIDQDVTDEINRILEEKDDEDNSSEDETEEVAKEEIDIPSMSTEED